MRSLRLATVAVLLSIISIHTTSANAQILDTGEGRCGRCGHSERDTQRYVNSFLNQIFFPNSVLRRGTIAASLYLFSGTYTMYGGRSPDPNFASVTIAITAELKGALPSGNYRVVVTTPGGKTSTESYAIGNVRFRVIGPLYSRVGRGSGSRAGAGGGGHSGPSTGMGTPIRPGNRSPAKCSRSRREDRGNETIAWCSQD
jgi:hypothetical protein